MSVPSFGFIMTRHVNSHLTNLYWNQNVRQLNTLYPECSIVIIDDNSNYDYVHSTEEHKNVQVVPSEFPKRGELLPYYYLLRDKYFPNAVILHDGVFFHQRIPFERFADAGLKVLPLWHFRADTENSQNTKRMVRALHNNHRLIQYLNPSHSSQVLKLLGKLDTDTHWVGCFGVKSYISLDFLEKIEAKYAITQLIPTITCRADRCCLERIMGCIFSIEFLNKCKHPSLMGDILQYQPKWGYSYQEYIADLERRKIKTPIVKVWTGR